MEEPIVVMLGIPQVYMQDAPSISHINLLCIEEKQIVEY